MYTQTSLQAQVAGVPYSYPLSNVTSRMAFFGPNMMFADLRCSPSCTRVGIHGTVVICPPDCFQYKRTLDVFYKIIRQLLINLDPYQRSNHLTRQRVFKLFHGHYKRSPSAESHLRS